MSIINNISSDPRDVESIATNLAIRDVPKIKMREKKMKRESNIKIENLKEFATTVDRRGILVGTVWHGTTAIMTNLRKQKEPLMKTAMS